MESKKKKPIESVKMSKRGKVSSVKRKRLTEAQKRRKRIVGAISRWNRKQGKGKRLNRKAFWETYREVSSNYGNTTEAVRAIRQGRFSLSGLSVKGRASGTGGKKGKRPRRFFFWLGEVWNKIWWIFA